MKKSAPLRGLLCSVIAASLIAGTLSCRQQGGGGTAQSLPQGSFASAEKNSFKEVTSHLDAGGNFYLYLGTEQFLNGLSAKVSSLRQFLAIIPNMNEGDRGTANKVIDLVTRLVKNSGIEEISGVGMSSIAREPGFYHSKMMLHHYKGQNSGYLWTLFGKSPHTLDLIDFLPSTTGLAMSCDLDLAQFWSILQREVSQLALPDADQFLRQLPAHFEQMTQIKFDQLLGSLGGEYGVVLTLDDKKMVTLPLGPNQSLEFPEPALMLVIKVKDDTIFNRVEKLVAENPNMSQAVVKVDKGGLKMRTMPLPLPLPVPIRPSLARYGDYLFLASTDDLIQAAVAAKKGEKALKSTEQYKKLSRGIPEKGNSFQYVSETLGTTILQIQKEAMSRNPALNPAQSEWLQKMMVPDRAMSSMAVGANTDEGWLMTGNGSQSLNKAVLVPAMILPAGLLAGIAIPNFVRARESAQYNAIINNLRMLDGAKQQWALENKKTDGTIVTDQNVSDYLRGGRVNPVVGEVYSLNPIGSPPSAKVPVKVRNHPAGSIITVND